MALGRLIASMQSDWEKDKAQDMARQFICDVDGLLQIDLDPDVQAKLILAKCEIQLASGQKEEARSSVEVLHNICQENKDILDAMIEVLNYEAGKIEKPVPNYRNIALLFSITKDLPGLGKRAETAVDWMIDAGARSDSLYDALSSVSKRLMKF